MTRWTLGVILVAISAATMAGPFPDHPLTLVVSYGPGGATSLQAHIVTMWAQEYLGQPIDIVNRPGAGGQIGWNWVIEKGSQDGYTLLAYNLPHFIAQSIVFRTKFSTANVAPVANWGADPAVLIVREDSPFTSVQEVVTYAREHPGTLTVSGAGLYVGHHVAALQLEKATGIRLKFRPARTGGVEALQQVLGGQVMAGINNLSDAFRARKELRIFAVADLERSALLPDVPTFRELGIAIDDTSVNYRGIAVPGGTPQAVIDLLAERVPAMFGDERVLGQMRKSGAPLRILTRAQVRKIFDQERATLEELLAELKQIR